MLAEIQIRSDEKENARRNLDAAIARQQRLIQSQPEAHWHRIWQARMQTQLAQLLMELDRPDAARQEIARIEESLEPLQDQDDILEDQRASGRIQKMRDQIAAAEVRLIEQQEGMPQRMGHLSFIFRALIPHDLPCSDPQ